jgi:hypothetical protein
VTPRDSSGSVIRLEWTPCVKLLDSPTQFIIYSNASMVISTFEVGITDLEKTDAIPVLLVEKAANLLGINLEQNIQKSTHVVRYKSEPGSHGFKEQWLLRWLLKKLTFPASKEGRDETWTVENR